MLFLARFGGNFFLKKIRLCHAQHLMGLTHHAEFQKKTSEPVLRKLPGRRTEGQTDEP